MPLDISVLILKGTTPDLKWTHCHSGANLCELDTVISGPNKDVVSELDAVVDVFERDNSTAHFVFAGYGLSWWENMLQYFRNTFS